MNNRYLDELGCAFLAHFSRRLADLIIEQGSEILHELGLVTPNTAISTVFYLDNNQDVTVAELASALRVSHQMATQRVNQLEKLGIVSRIKHSTDKRAKCIVLSPIGQAEIEPLRNFTKRMDKVFADFEKELGCDLNQLIRRAENALQATPLKRRLSKRGN